MHQFVHIQQDYKAFFIFGGTGGGALGAQMAQAEYRGLLAQCEVLGSIDVDAQACADFEMWTGVPSTQMDLFDRDQYRAWHGHEPPADWREVTLEDIRAAAQHQRPNVVVITAPCKGFSGLLGKNRAQTPKYEALNRLAERGVFLTLEAWADDPPEFLFFENVKGITTRGARFLRNIKQLMARYGYVFHDEHYDCAPLGGLGQHRRRFMLVARRADKVPNWLYNPPAQRVKSIGEVFEEAGLPLPDDPAGGPMHRLPRLAWKTWIRLALIPPGGDWRDLRKVKPGEYCVVPIPGRPGWFDIMRTKEARAAGIPITGDLEQPHMNEAETHPNKYRVADNADPAPTVTGTRFGSGALALADHRLGHTPMGEGRGAYLVQDTDDPSLTVTGDPSHRKSGGASVIADPRLGHDARDGSHAVADADEPSGPVVGSAAVTSSNGVAALADPRYDREPRAGVYSVEDMDGPSRTVTWGKDSNGSMLHVADARMGERFNNVQRVTDMDQPTGAVTAAAATSNAAAVVADPRLSCTPRNGTMGVQAWDEPGVTVLGAGDVHAGAAAVADPRMPGSGTAGTEPARIPADDERGVWFIRSPHRDRRGRRCVHRPMTTLELMVLQSFPWRRPDGSPVVLAGQSDRSWRERIGNALPPMTMKAIMEQMMRSLLASETGDFLLDVYQSGRWVREPEQLEA